MIEKLTCLILFARFKKKVPSWVDVLLKLSYIKSYISTIIVACPLIGLTSF
jgi:hypothetical protein